MKVLVTSATRNSGLAVIRSLARQGVAVIGTDDRRLPGRAGEQHLQRFYRHPCTQRAEVLLDALQAIIERERPDVLFPIDGTRALARHQARFAPRVGLLLPDGTAFDTAHDNQAALQTCRRLGIPCPLMYTPAEAARLLAAGNRGRTGKAGTCLVIKPRDDVGGGRGIRYVHTRRELEEWLPRVERRWGPVVIQEYIPGGTESMRTVNLLFDRNSRLAAWFTMRKLRQWPNRGGITALGVSTREPGLVELLRPFFQTLGWRGLAEAEIKVDARDGTPKVIEINPRVWGYIGFPIHCGIDFPLLACQLAAGRPSPGDLPLSAYPSGRKYLNPSAYLKAALAELASQPGRGALLKRLRRELRGPLVGNHLGAGEAAAMLAKMAGESLSRAQERI